MGFSGAYLDIIDAYYYWPDKGEAPISERRNIEETADDMIQFVIKIAEYARNKNPNFLIVPQNGEDILEYDFNNKYLNVISGIGIEDLFYTTIEENGQVKIVKSDEINYRLQFLRKIIDSKKFVLSIDYIVDNDNLNIEIIDNYINQCRKNGIIPYPAYVDRNLDEISTMIFDIEIY